MISPCPPYYSSALFCLLRSHHVLLFRLVASDCLSCSAKLGRSVLSSSLALSFSMPLASCLLLSCYSARILSALLYHEAASIWYWEARLRLSHQGTQTDLCVSCVCRGAEARMQYCRSNFVGQTWASKRTPNCTVFHDDKYFWQKIWQWEISLRDGSVETGCCRYADRYTLITCRWRLWTAPTVGVSIGISHVSRQLDPRC